MNVQLESFFNLNSGGAIAAPATAFIYGLNDPTTGKCRYVGKAADPHKRFEKHLLLSGKSRTHKNHWIRGLAAQGLKPVLEVLDEVPVSEWQFWEREYIRVFRMVGFKLTNLTDGGEGTAGMGRKFSEETRAKMSLVRIGKNPSPETRAKLRVANLGKKRSPETCAKMSATRTGIKLSPETCAKIGAARRGKTVSEETRAKMSAAGMGRRVSEETRAKMGKAQIERWKNNGP